MGPHPTRPTVFLDRDGVICFNRDDHVKSWAEFEFIPGSLEAIARLTEAGCGMVVISNQAIVNRGLVEAAVVEDIHRRMLASIEAARGRVLGALYCPHRREEGCGCRKPAPGLLRHAISSYGLALSPAFLVGDHESDMLAAEAVGAEPIFVLSGRGNPERGRLCAANLSVAADLIIARIAPGSSSSPAV